MLVARSGQGSQPRDFVGQPCDIGARAAVALHLLALCIDQPYVRGMVLGLTGQFAAVEQSQILTQPIDFLRATSGKSPS